MRDLRTTHAQTRELQSVVDSESERLKGSLILCSGDFLLVQTDSPVFVCETYYVYWHIGSLMLFLGAISIKAYLVLFTWYTAVYVTDLILSHFLSEVRPLGLADATAFSRLPCFAGHHRPDRPPRSCLTRWLPSFAPLSSMDDCTRLLGVSHRFWYQIVGYYPGDCCDGVL